MTYVLLAQAKKELKGSVIVKVQSIGELKAGTTKDGSDWTKKDAVIKDNSGEQKLTLWNDDIAKIHEGKCYKLEQPFWKDYEGKPNLSLGQYCKIHDATESDLLPFEGQQESPQPTPEKTEIYESYEAHAREFAEKCVTSYIKTCTEKGIEAKDIAGGTSAVYNTALMQKMKK